MPLRTDRCRSWRPSVSYLSMIESGKRMPSEQSLLACWPACSSARSAWFLDDSAEIGRPPASSAPRRRRAADSAGTGVPVLQGTAAVGDPGAAAADRHQRAAVRAPADPLAPGNVAQRFSRSRAQPPRAWASAGFPLSVEDLTRLAKHHGLELRWFDRRPVLVRDKDQRGAQHGALVLRAAAHRLSEPRAAR